jgi:hypothetical protein
MSVAGIAHLRITLDDSQTGGVLAPHRDAADVAARSLDRLHLAIQGAMG